MDTSQTRYAIIGPTINGKITRMLLDAFHRRGIFVQQIVPSQTGFLIPNKDNRSKIYLDTQQEPPDVALVRGVGSKVPSKIFYRLDWMWILERIGTHLINSRSCLEIATNKMLTNQALVSRAIPTPMTVMCESANLALKAFDDLGGNIVYKPLYGSRGKGIMLVQNRVEAEKLFCLIEQNEEVFYIQQYQEHHNEDFRLLVVGNEVIASMKRTSTTWLTNIAQGGRAIAFTPSEEMKELAIKSAESVGGEIIGVDIMDTDQGLMIIEVNSVPGYQGLQSVTPFDISDRIVGYLEKSWKK